MKRRRLEIGIHRCKASRRCRKHGRDRLPRLPRDVRLGCQCVPFRAPKAHGVQYLGDLIVVEGHESLEHLRASRSKQQEHL